MASELFVFKTKSDITDEQKKQVNEGVIRFNERYAEKISEKVFALKGKTKIHQMLFDKLGGSLDPTAGGRLIEDVVFEPRTITLRLNKNWIEWYDQFVPHLGKLFKRKDAEMQSGLIRRLLKGALKNYVELGE